MVGSTGPKDDSSGISAYAERYVHTPKTQELMANTETVVVLDVTGPLMNAFYTTENAITLFEVGIYKIDYFLTTDPKTEMVLTIGVNCNNTLISGSDISGDGIADYFTQLTGTIIVELVHDDVLTLVIKADRATSLSFNGSTNAKLSIIKLS